MISCPVPLLYMRITNRSYLHSLVHCLSSHSILKLNNMHSASSTFLSCADKTERLKQDYKHQFSLSSILNLLSDSLYFSSHLRATTLSCKTWIWSEYLQLQIFTQHGAVPVFVQLQQRPFYLEQELLVLVCWSKIRFSYRRPTGKATDLDVTFALIDNQTVSSAQTLISVNATAWFGQRCINADTDIRCHYDTVFIGYNTWYQVNMCDVVLEYLINRWNDRELDVAECESIKRRNWSLFPQYTDKTTKTKSAQ